MEKKVDRYCPYCRQKEVIFKKVYKDGDTLIHSPNKFYFCQNPKCIYYVQIKIGKLTTPAADRPFFYVKTTLW